MSGYIDIVYGCILPHSALTEELEDLCDALRDREDIEVMSKPYAGNGDAPWYCGVCVTTLRQGSCPDEGFEVHNFIPNNQHITEAKNKLALVPEVLKSKITDIGLYVIPCP